MEEAEIKSKHEAETETLNIPYVGLGKIISKGVRFIYIAHLKQLVWIDA